MFGKALMIIAALAVVTLFVKPNFSGRAWDFALLGVLILQIGVWYALAHEMPWRFMAPAIVLVILLAAGGLSRLMHWKFNLLKIFTPRSALAKMNWGMALAMGVFIAIMVLNFLSNVQMFSQQTRGKENIPPWSGQEIAMAAEPYASAGKLGSKAKIMLIGEGASFYYPPGTIYATAFDNHPLDELARLPLSDAELMARLGEMGVTHVLAVWPEISRLAKTYGYPASLSSDLYSRRLKGDRPGLAILDRLKAAQAREEKIIAIPHSGGQRTVKIDAASQPRFTIYTLP